MRIELTVVPQALLEHNAKVYIACRNQQKAEATITELHAITGKHASFLNLDLANLHSVREATEEFIRCILSSWRTFLASRLIVYEAKRTD